MARGPCHWHKPRERRAPRAANTAEPNAFEPRWNLRWAIENAPDRAALKAPIEPQASLSFGLGAFPEGLDRAVEAIHRGLEVFGSGAAGIGGDLRRELSVP